MPKVKISEFSATPSNNTDIDGINIAEGCAPSGINDAIRELMAQLKDWQSGTSNDPYVVGSSGSLTLNQGTANGVAYLNGSKVLTTGSALTFDGTTFATTGIASFAAGSASAPALTRTGDTNTGIFFPAADTIAFAEGGVESARLDSSGNLGLGVTPSAWASAWRAIQLPTGSVFSPNNGSFVVAANVFTDGAATNRYVTNNFATYHDQTNGSYRWFTAPSGTAGNAISFTQAMTLDASGQLGIGVTSMTAPLELRSASGSNNSINFVGNGSFGASTIGFFSSDKATRHDFIYGDSTGLQFGTNNTERARIDSSGNLLVGRTSGFAFATARLAVEHGQADYVQALGNSHPTVPYGIAMRYTAASPNNTGSAYIYADDSGGTQRFSVRSNGGVYNFSGNNSNLSDRREKTNFAPAKSYLETICAIPVQTFNYIDQNMEDDPGLTLGVVAQDVQAVAPELVMESNWGTQDNPKMRLSVYQIDLQYALMKCIQEQQALIQTLTARVAALESN